MQNSGVSNGVKKIKAFCCWSGGKDSLLSCYKAMQNQDVEIAFLLNMISEDSRHSRTHGISSRLLQLQADAIGVPLVQEAATWEGYEEEFKKVVLELKKKGIQSGIFGDIDFKEHRDWGERVCKEIGIDPVFPLWKQERENLLREFIRAGFKAVVVATRADFLGKEWLGREITGEFIEELKHIGGIDISGEKGEYHTFVYDGPVFKSHVEFGRGRKISRDGHWFLEIVEI